MAIRTYGLSLTMVLGAALAGACGGADGNGLYGEKGGAPGDGGSTSGSGGQSAGGSSTGGGNAGGSPTGGRSGVGGSSTGGVQNTGGTSNGGGGDTATGGTTTLPDGGTDCSAPASPSNAVLCVTFTPENIRARSGDTNLDKMGTLIVQVFDGAVPDAGAKPLAQEVIPADPSQEISVDELPTVRLEGQFPATAYVRAAFVDNPEAFVSGGPGWGAWLGGVDLSPGIIESQALLPVQVDIGKARDLSMDLTAFRRLSVTVGHDVEHKGDAEGTLTVSAVRTDTPMESTPILGFGTLPCAKLDEGDAVVEGFIIGSGQFHLAGVLNDLGKDGALPPGAMVSINTDNDPPTLDSTVNVGTTAYSVSFGLTLQDVIPFNGNVPANSCKDLGLE